jgi:hypothetical protein
VKELVDCILRSMDRPVAEYAASAMLVLSHNHPGLLGKLTGLLQVDLHGHHALFKDSLP